jgi:hypothetical protein
MSSTRAEELTPPGPGVRGGDKQRVQIAGARLPADVGEHLGDLGRAEEEPVPELPLPPPVHPAAVEDRPDLVVGAERLRLLLLREDEFDLWELDRDVPLAVRPVPDEAERRDRLPDRLRFHRVAVVLLAAPGVDELLDSPAGDRRQKRFPADDPGEVLHVDVLHLPGDGLLRPGVKSVW